MSEKEAFSQIEIAVYDEFRDAERWLVKPNPDAPDLGVCIQYQEWDEEHHQYLNKGRVICIGNGCAEQLADALHTTIGVM